MKNLFRIILVLLIPLSSFSEVNRMKQGKYTREKNIHKNYAVNSDALLKINTEYSNININTWDKNEVAIDIIIRVNGDDEEKVIQSLKDSKIKIYADKSQIDIEALLSKSYSQKTSKGEEWSFSLGDWLTISGKGGKNATRKMMNIEVNYQIKMPVSNHLKIINTYGNLQLTRLKGNCDLDCSYGSLNIGELLSDNNMIKIDYSSNTHIDALNKAYIRADYCTLHIEKAQKLELRNDYTHTTIGQVKDLNYNCDYGSLKVENVHNIAGNGDYIQTRLGNIEHQANLSCDYGSLKITELRKGFRNIRIKADYASVKVYSTDDNAFKFRVDTEFSSLHWNEKYILISKDKDDFNEHYRGFLNDKNADSFIEIENDYGGVEIY